MRYSQPKASVNGEQGNGLLLPIITIFLLIVINQEVGEVTNKWSGIIVVMVTAV
jgi:hypothetical protein